MRLVLFRWLALLCISLSIATHDSQAASQPAKTAHTAKPAKKAKASKPPSPGLHARVTLSVRNGQAYAHYQLNQSVSRLPLQRKAPVLRERSWTIKTANVTLQDGALVGTKGRKFNSVDIVVSPVLRGEVREYDPVTPFADGGLAVYTGQFVMADAAGGTEFELRPAPGETYVLFGRRRQEPMEWTANPGDDGTIVYFGNSPVVDSSVGLAVLDAGLPPWLFQRIARQFPRITDFYAQGLGSSPVQRPFLLVSADPRPESGSGIAAQVLEGVLQFRLSGPEWQQETEQQGLGVEWNLAHELAHFWNTPLALDTRIAWMHEGSAEGFAYRALQATGTLSPEQVAKGYSEALAHCAWMLDGKAVNAAFAEGQHQVPQQCGAIMALLTERALQRKNPAADLFSFWRELLTEARPEDGTYTQEMYFRVLSRLLGDDSLANYLRGMANNGFGGSESVAAWFAELGMPLMKADSRADPALSELVYHRLLETLQRQDCGDGLSLTVYADSVQIEGQPECKTLQQPLRLIGIAGHRFFADGAAAWDAAALACGSRGKVTLMLQAASPGQPQSLELPCTALRPRAQFYRFTPQQFASPVPTPN